MSRRSPRIFYEGDSRWIRRRMDHVRRCTGKHGRKPVLLPCLASDQVVKGLISTTGWHHSRRSLREDKRTCSMRRSTRLIRVGSRVGVGVDVWVAEEQ